jgi:Leishmanolysin
LATVIADYQTYRARADAERAELLAATTSPFTIEIRFLGGLNARQRAAFTAAADRWTRIIVGDLPAVMVDGEVIDDILILAQGTAIDGPGRILGQAGPTHLRPAAAGASAFLPAKGIMSFDTADLAQMATAGTLRDVITHEMGHVLGIGTLWEQKDLLKGGGTSNPTFAGPAAMEEYRRLRGDGRRRRVPVENTGGPGTRDGHWRETVFRNELMSGFISEPGNPLSRVTAASLGDLGYQVDIDAAEPYELPNLLAVAESGALVAHAAPIDVGMMLPVIPITLPRDSLQEGSRARRRGR